MKRLILCFHRFTRNESGAVLVLTAAALVAILGAMALTADIGALALERNRLQNACDAAALAAAWELPDASFAREKAKEYLMLNNVDPNHATITLNADGSKITVEARRAVEFKFAPVLGISSGTAAGKAVACFGSISGATGVVPFGIPDQELSFGQEYQLKAGSHEDYGPGNYGALALDLRGAQSYLNNLKYGYKGTIKVGDWIETEPGNMSGPTFDGVTYRINSCQHTPRCSIDRYDRNCPMVMIVPIYEPSSLQGRSQVKIVGFGAFLLKGVSGKGTNSRVSGYFLETIPPDGMNYTIDPNQEDYGLRTAKLISE